MTTLDINSAIEALMVRGYNRGVAKEPPFDPDSPGVPPQMFASGVDDDGWVEWCRTPSAATENQVLALFSSYGIKPPAGLLEYLLSDCHLVDQVNNGRVLYSLPHIPADNPLGPIRRLLSSWRGLVSAGYVPVAEMEDAWGPICVRVADGPVVWFDHDQMAGIGPGARESELASIARPLFETLGDLYADIFSPPT